MDRLNTNDSFKYIWRVWQLLGVHPPAKLRRPYFVYAVLVNLVGSVASPLSVFMNAFFLGDAGLVMHSLQISPTIIVSTLKQFLIFLHLGDLQQVEPYLDRLDRRGACHAEDDRYLRKVIRQCHFLELAIQTSLVCSFLSYLIPGLTHKGLIMEGWLPFDWSASNRNYACAIGFQLFTTVFQIIQNGANDAYALMYINVVRGHMRVFCMRVARIGRDMQISPEANYAELRHCIEDHKNVISLFETIRPVISKTVVAQFVITAFVLCISAIYYLVFNRELSQLISTLIYIAAILMEIFPVCYFGNVLMEETDRLTSAIYSCNWMDQPVRFRKCLIIFMQRSQRTNMIQAGLTTITLQTFVAIIRFSFSMFTLMSRLQ